MYNTIRKIVSVILIAMLLGSNFTFVNSVSAKKGGEGGGEQITFCHVPDGNDGNPITITTSLSAYEEGHQNHELDYIGECIPADIGVTKTVNGPNEIGTGVYEVDYNIEVNNAGGTSFYTLTDNIDLPAGVTSVVSGLAFVSDDDTNPVPAVNSSFNGDDQNTIITNESILTNGSDSFTYKVTYTVDSTATPSEVNCNGQENTERIVLVKNNASILDLENESSGKCIELSIPEEIIPEEPPEEENPPGDEEEQEMMTFCHVPVGNPAKPITIEMPVMAYERSSHPTHELDYLGICHIPKIEMEKTIDGPNEIGFGTYKAGYNVKVNNVGWTGTYTLYDNIVLPAGVTSVVSGLTFVSDDDLNPVPAVNPLFNGIDQNIIITDEDTIGSSTDEFAYDVTYTVDPSAAPSEVNCNGEPNTARIVLVTNTATTSDHVEDEDEGGIPEDKGPPEGKGPPENKGEEEEEETVGGIICTELPIPDDIPRVNFVASKIVCDDESYLPNWGTGGEDIDENTAVDFLATGDNSRHCELVEDRKFQWGYNDVANPGDDYYGEATDGWHTFIGSVVIPSGDISQIRIREVLEDGYIPFTYGPNGNTNDDNVSAEMYCHKDVLNYDNYERVDLDDSETYYCLGFNYKPPVLEDTIGGYKFNDMDYDGVWDEGESTMSGWTVTLSGASYTGTTVTNENGYYSFTDIQVGEYTVCEVQQEGWTQTYPTANEGCHIVDLALPNGVDHNFGNHENEIIIPGSIGGYKFNDVDNDGVWDEGEATMSGWTVTLSGASYTGTTVTNENGYYLFTDISVGEYTVCEVQQEGWTQTYPATNEGCHIVDLALPNGVNHDFGNHTNEIIIPNPPPPIISGGGGGGGGGGGRPGVNLTTYNVEEKPVAAGENVADEITQESDSTGPSGIDETYENYVQKKKQLEDIINSEKKQGSSGIKSLPKILLKTGTPISERVGKKKDNRVELDVPAMVPSYINDINVWKKKLPEIDRNRNEYIVIPSNGLIVPVNYVPETSKDYEKLINGKDLNVNPYLKNGVMSYPGTSVNDYGEVGNRVIYGHSSYWKSDDGRYKTQFQKIIELNVGEEIWVYKMQSNGVFKRFIYKVEKSFETVPTNVGVLEPGMGSNLTLITCTPIGDIKLRWVVRARFVNENKTGLENYLFGNNVSVNNKLAINRLLGQIEGLETTKRIQKTIEVFSKVQNLQAINQNNSKMFNLYNYLKLKLALSYKKVSQ